MDPSGHSLPFDSGSARRSPSSSGPSPWSQSLLLPDYHHWQDVDYPPLPENLDHPLFVFHSPPARLPTVSAVAAAPPQASSSSNVQAVVSTSLFRHPSSPSPVNFFQGQICNNGTQESIEAASLPLQVPVSVVQSDQPHASETSGEVADRNLVVSKALQRGRVKYDWEGHREQIHKLYMVQGQPLEETMRIMAQKYGFAPSIKMYKSKINKWGWSKNLAMPIAEWMIRKANQRKPKNTTFTCRGRTWNVQRIEQTVKRGAGQVQWGESADTFDAPTPLNVTYETPRVDHPTPGNNVLSPNNSLLASAPPDKRRPLCVLPSREAIAPNATAPSGQSIRITWNGYKAADILPLRQEAHHLDRLGRRLEAEKKFKEAVSVSEHLLSSTHTETSYAVRELASFYAQHDRMNDAYAVLDWIIEKHTERWGLLSQETVNCMLLVAELLASWSCNDDSRALIFRVLDLLDKTQQSSLVNAVRGLHEPPVSPLRRREHNSALSPRQPPAVTQSQFPIVAQSSRSGVQDGIGSREIDVDQLQRGTRLTNESSEPLLLRLLAQCESRPREQADQLLKLRLALFDLWKMSGNSERMVEGLVETKTCVMTMLKDLGVDANDKSKSGVKTILKLIIQVARHMYLETARLEDAEEILQLVGCRAADTFGEDGEATISLYLSIGILFQDNDMWENAQPWFEQALVASMTANGVTSPLSLNLETALENQYFELPKPSIATSWF